MRARGRTIGTRDRGLKLYRRHMVLDGREYTVLGLRPGADVRFSTNRFHETGHILSDLGGARVLGRLLWGLAFQGRPGAVQVAMLGDYWWRGSDYVYLDDDRSCRGVNGEVQIFRQYRRMVTAARRARDDFADRTGREPGGEELPGLWDEAARLRRCGMPPVPARAQAALRTGSLR